MKKLTIEITSICSFFIIFFKSEYIFIFFGIFLYLIYFCIFHIWIYSAFFIFFEDKILKCFLKLKNCDIYDKNCNGFTYINDSNFDKDKLGDKFFDGSYTGYVYGNYEKNGDWRGYRGDLVDY